MIAAADGGVGGIAAEGFRIDFADEFVEIKCKIGEDVDFMKSNCVVDDVEEVGMEPGFATLKGDGDIVVLRESFEEFDPCFGINL